MDDSITGVVRGLHHIKLHSCVDFTFPEIVATSHDTSDSHFHDYR